MDHPTSKSEIQTFLHNIYWLRKQFGISKKKMAELLGISIWSLNKIKRGELPPELRIDVLYAVQRHFGISPSGLLTQWQEDR